jgi:uncharacterized protein (DUF433 family)
MAKPSTLSDRKTPDVVRKTPNVCGGEACIRDTRHTVSGLTEWQTLGLSDDQIRERHPDLTQADLDAAWSYYRENCDEIDEIIRQDKDT